MKKLSVKILAAILIVAISLPLFGLTTTSIQAATHTAVSDTLTRLKASTVANHTIAFTLASAWDASEDVVIDFTDGDGFNTSGFAITEPEDFDITWNGTDKPIVASGGCVANSIEVNAVNTTTDTFTFRLCATSTASAANDPIVIEIGTNATFGAAGNDQITNATSAGSKTVTITGPTSGDSASLALPIMDDDQVTVSATVDPTITSDITPGATPYSCALGTLTTSVVNGCTYTNTISTNASGGYVAQIQDDGNLRSGANDVNDVSDGVVTAGVEEYGASSDDTVGTPAFANYDGTCGTGATEAATGLSATLVTYADKSGPSGPSGDAVILCHSASIAADTPSGSFSHIVTHITTGTF